GQSSNPSLSGSRKMRGQSEGGALGVAEPAQLVVRLEDLLLLSRYEEAARASSELLSQWSEGPKAPDALLQRALVAALQAHFFSGRQGEVELLLEALGVRRLPVPTFLAWMLLLLESQQASAARRRVESYMAELVAQLRQQQQPQEHLSAGCAAAAAASDLQATSPGAAEAGGDNQERSMQSEASATSRAAAEAAAASPAPAVSLQDRAALARLYSQDVLTQGLRLPEEALRWLQPQSHRACGEASHTRPTATALAAKTGTGAAAPQGTGTVGVVDAVELLGGEAAVAGLRSELEELLTAAGFKVPALGPPEATAGQQIEQQQWEQQQQSCGCDSLSKVEGRAMAQTQSACSGNRALHGSGSSSQARA
ncbi:hypothetical protein Agub_g3998, partial [Astrephomene gubernaculifera]